MKEFDWEIYAAQGHRPEWIKWMKMNYNCCITEEEFVRAYQALRKADARARKARRYGRSKVAAQYRNLRNDFGFFLVC
jgi:hypothetical protein